MPNVRMPVNNLLSGVSQQPKASRNGDQCEVMDNAWPNAVDGLTKRQPSEHIAQLSSGASANWKYHFIDRSVNEKYLIVFKDAAISAFDLTTGASRVVRDVPATSFAYLDSPTTSAFEDFEALTVADHTFVTNKTKVTAMAATTSPAEPDNKAYVFLRQGNYETTYTVRIVLAGGGGTGVVEIATWDGNNSSGGSTTPSSAITKLNSIKTEKIIETLRLKINALATSVVANRAGGVGTEYGSVLELDLAAGFDSVETGDSVGDSVLSVIHKEVPRVAGYLPETCRHGFRVKVAGDAEIDADNYYVRFEADGGTGVFGDGHWIEDVGYGEEIRLDATTLPHILTRNFDDASGTITGTAYQAYFDWNVAPWLDKTVGDSTLVPRPSFIGKSVSALAFFKERLVFVSDDKVNMTETGEPFNFWRTTLLTLRDTAPIDLTINHDPVALLEGAVAYNENLLLKSSRSQFILRGSDILSPRTIQVVPVSEYENYGDRSFVPAGRSVFFSFRRGDQSGIREFFQLGESLTYDAVDITAQVPNYLSGKVSWIAVSTLEETMVVKTVDAANELYIYKYLWAGNQKILSSWGTWKLNPGLSIRAGYFVDNTFYLVTEYTSGGATINLEKVNLASGLKDSGTDWITHADRRIDNGSVSSEVYSAEDDQTVITLPFNQPSGEQLVVEKITGVRFQVVSTTINTVTVRGDVTAKNYWVGLQYTMTYEFTAPVLKLPAGQGFVPASGQVAKARQLHIEYHTSGVFLLTTQVGRRTLYTTEISGPEPDFSVSVVETVELKTGSASVKVMGRAEEVTAKIINEGPYPSNITSAVWTLFTHPRGGRLPS